MRVHRKTESRLIKNRHKEKEQTYILRKSRQLEKEQTDLQKMEKQADKRESRR